VIQEGVAPSLPVAYKRCPVKQYSQEGRARRTETTINDPTDLRVRQDIARLAYLPPIGRQVHRRRRDVQRVSQDCTRSQPSGQRVVQPTVADDGQRAPGLRLGAIGVLALLAALIVFVHLPSGLTHRALRPRVAGYRGADRPASTTGQMTYDRRRLRRTGLLWRVPPTPRYLVTPYGYKVALLLTKRNARVFPTTFAATDPTEPLPPPLAEAFAAVDRQIAAILEEAKLDQAA